MLLAGCGAQNGLNLASSSPDTPGASIKGIVHGGQQPVAGATVSLYEAGTGGYGTGARLLAQATTSTDGLGTFSFAAGSYTCTASPGDQTFLVAAGGNPGGGANPNLMLMAALGSCSGIADEFVVINEVTTVASAYSLAQFLTYTSGSIDTPPATAVAAGATPYFGIPTSGGSCNSGGGWLSTGSSTCNYIGLKNAMATVNNLVNFIGAGTNGTVPSNSKIPSYTTAGITHGNDSYVPSARINTLADILSSCVNSVGGVAGDSSNCGNLFQATTPAATGIAPTDTLQAIVNLAQNPQLTSANNTLLFGLVGSTPPFNVPAAMTAKPNDWTLALAFTGGGFTNATLGPSAADSTYSSGLAIDQQGNVWASNLDDDGADGSGSIAGFNNQGVPLTPATTSGAWGGYTGGGNVNLPFGDPAVDINGNVWLTNYTGTLAAITSGGAALSTLNGGSPVALPATVSGTYPVGVAVDPSTDAWVEGIPSAGTGTGLAKFSSAGATLLSPAVFNDGTAGYGGISLDNNGNVWASTEEGDLQVSASAGTLTHFYSGAANYGELAVSTAGDVFGCNTAHIYEDEPGGTPTYLTLSSSGGCEAGGEYAPNALDGLGNLWEPVLAGGEAIGHLSEVSSSTGTTLSPATYGYQGIGAPGFYGGTDGEPNTLLVSDNVGGTQSITGTAVDGSGNVWVLNAYAGNGVASHQLVEFVGLGAPTVTPTVLAQKYNTFTTLP